MPQKVIPYVCLCSCIFPCRWLLCPAVTVTVLWNNCKRSNSSAWTVSSNTNSTTKRSILVPEDPARVGTECAYGELHARTHARTRTRTKNGVRLKSRLQPAGTWSSAAWLFRRLLLPSRSLLRLPSHLIALSCVKPKLARLKNIAVFLLL